MSQHDDHSLGVSESDEDLSLYRTPGERPVAGKGRRSQSMDDVRDDGAASDQATGGSDKIYDDVGDAGENGNAEENITTDDDAETRLAGETVAEDQPSGGISEHDVQSVRVVPVSRAESFKEAMRSPQLEPARAADFSRTFSQPPPSTERNRASWVMPAFPSLEEVFSEWATSAMARTHSVGSGGGGTPVARSQSEASNPECGRRARMRIGGSSPLNIPDFHNKRLSRLFDFEPSHLGSISGSSDSLDSNEGPGSSAAGRLPPGFETGFLKWDFRVRPPLFGAGLPQCRSESNFVHDRPLPADTSGTSDSGKDIGYDTVLHKSGSTSRTIPIKVVASQSTSGGENASSEPSAASDRRVTKTASLPIGTCTPAEVKSGSVSDSDSRSSLFATKHGSHSAQLPAGFLTGFGSPSVPAAATSSVADKADRRGGSVRVISVSDADNQRKVRVVPVSFGQNAESFEAAKRRQQQHGATRGRVIPIMVQSTHQSNAAVSVGNWTSTTSSGSVSIPVTVIKNDGRTGAQSSAFGDSDRSGRPESDGTYLPLCYDDGSGETVKRILQEMTIRRLPIRDTVNLLNMKTSRSMDSFDSRRHAIREGTPSGNPASVESPTVDLLPPGFCVGNSAEGVSGGHLFSTPAAPVPGNLIRRRLQQFDSGDADSQNLA